jgi:hypothetical protein
MLNVPIFLGSVPTLGARGPLNCRDPQISHKTATGALGIWH